MLAKLLKYELPAMGRKLLPLYAAWAVTAVVLGIATQTSASKSDLRAILSILLYVGVTVAIMVLSVVMIIQRYSTSLLGEEGYFSHVLPVSVSAHIGNKLISAVIWVTVTMLVALLTGLLILLGIGITTGFEGYDMSYIEVPKRFWLYAFEFILIMIVGIVKMVMQIYAAITIGHQAQNHTTLASIGAYIAVLMFEGAVGRISAGVIPVFRQILSQGEYQADLYGPDGILMFNKVFIPAMLMSLAFSAVYFFICKYLMEKRLNLA